MSKNTNTNKQTQVVKVVINPEKKTTKKRTVRKKKQSQARPQIRGIMTPEQNMRMYNTFKPPDVNIVNTPNNNDIINAVRELINVKSNDIYNKVQSNEIQKNVIKPVAPPQLSKPILPYTKPVAPPIFTPKSQKEEDEVSLLGDDTNESLSKPVSFDQPNEKDIVPEPKIRNIDFPKSPIPSIQFQQPNEKDIFPNIADTVRMYENLTGRTQDAIQKVKDNKNTGYIFDMRTSGNTPIPTAPQIPRSPSVPKQNQLSSSLVYDESRAGFTSPNRSIPLLEYTPPPIINTTVQNTPAKRNNAEMTIYTPPTNTSIRKNKSSAEYTPAKRNNAEMAIYTPPTNTSIRKNTGSLISPIAQSSMYESLKPEPIKFNQAQVVSGIRLTKRGLPDKRLRVVRLAQESQIIGQ